QLMDYMPTPLPQMRQWMRAVTAAEEKPDYAAWVARNWEKLDGSLEIENLHEWVRAGEKPRGLNRFEPPPPASLIKRPFTPTMSVRTVRQLSAEWHEAVKRERERETERLGPFPELWFPAGTLAAVKRSYRSRMPSNYIAKAGRCITASPATPPT